MNNDLTELCFQVDGKDIPLKRVRISKGVHGKRYRIRAVIGKPLEPADNKNTLMFVIMTLRHELTDSCHVNVCYFKSADVTGEFIGKNTVLYLNKEQSLVAWLPFRPKL